MRERVAGLLFLWFFVWASVALLSSFRSSVSVDIILHLNRIRRKESDCPALEHHGVSFSERRWQYVYDDRQP